MADLTGGQLVIDGTNGDFEVVNDAWFPLEEALTPMWFGGDLEGGDTQVGGGDWVLNPIYHAQTRIQIPMLFMGHIDHNGDRYEVVQEGFESNVNHWRVEVLDPTVVARTARLIMPSGEERPGVMSRLRLVKGGGFRQSPGGWPLMFEFTLPQGPFAADGS